MRNLCLSHTHTHTHFLWEMFSLSSSLSFCHPRSRKLSILIRLTHTNTIIYRIDADVCEIHIVNLRNNKLCARAPIDLKMALKTTRFQIYHTLNSTISICMYLNFCQIINFQINVHTLHMCSLFHNISITK